MRIHKLNLKNIASLRGNHSIDFEAIHRDSPLFAITGKTGSGKSTILNSISLALFGDVYKKDSQNNDFVSLGEADGEIILEFSAKENTYCATWSMKVKKKNGDYLKKPQLLRLLELKKNGTFHPIETPIEEIIGLNFNQFCKTSILNQGEFARFLTSSFKDRKIILEKFYDGIDLETLNIKLREKMKHQQQDLTERSQRITGISEAIEKIETTPEVVTILKAKSNDLHLIFRYLDSNKSKLSEIQKQYDIILANEKRTIETKLNFEKDQLALNLLQKTGEKLNADFKQAKEIYTKRKPVLEICIEKHQTLSHLGEQNNIYIKNKSDYESQSEKAKAQIRQESNNIKELESSIDQLTKISPEVASFDLRSLISEKEQATSSLAKQLEINLNLEKVATQLTHEKKMQVDNNKELTDLISKQKESSKDNLQAKLEVLEKQADGLKALLQLIENSIIEHEQLKQKDQSIKKDLEKLATKQTSEQKGWQALIDQIKLFENTIELNQLKNAIHLCQTESLLGGNCVVCNTPVNKINIIQNEDESELENALNKVKELQIKAEQEKLKLEDLRVQILGLKNEKNSVQEKIKSLNGKCLIVWNKYSDLPLLENILKPAAIQLVKEYARELTKEINIIKDIMLKKEIDVQKLGHAQEKAEEIAARLKDYQLEHKELTSEYKIAVEKFEIITQRYGCENKDLKTSLKKLNSILSNVEAYQSLQEKIHQANNIIKNASEIQNQSQKKIKSIKLKINETASKTEDLKSYLTTHAHAKLSPRIELDKLTKDYEEKQKLVQQNKDETNKLNITIAQAKSKLDSFKEQIKMSSLMLKKEQKEIGESSDQMNNELYLSFSQFKNLPSLMDKISKFDAEDLELEKILMAGIKQYEDFLADAKESQAQGQKELTEAATLLKQKEEGQRQIANIKKESESFSNDLIKLENLNELIGKDEFRNYILSIIEGTLIDQTNSELQELCQGRYSINQANKSNRLITEFKIVDHFADGLERKISTLSGGETFLVSLAMALALAELTRGSAELDSLFIDEGFGTLDHETIDEVYELLVTIQHSGKQIGIISHVQELTHRIPINIHLEKSATGASHIEVVEN